MSTKKFIAVMMVATMVFGSTVTSFATETGANGATGTGTNTGHLNEEVYTTVLPTTATIADYYNFTIDPENILASADLFTDGTTAVGSAFANEDLVYFKQASDATKPYASTSQAAEVGAKNAIDIDVSVTATIGDPAEGKTIIPMVASSDELTAATTPSLFLQLKVGSKTVPVTSVGAAVTEKIAGQKSNFEAKRQNDGTYMLVEKSNVTWTNNVAAIQLIGKVKGGTVDASIVAPKVTLTWTVSKHVDNAAPSIATTTYNLAAGTAVAVTTNFGAGASAATSITGVEKPDGGALASSNYSVSGNVITFSGEWVDKILVGMEGGASKKYKVVFNTGDKIELTFTKPNG